MGRRISTVLMTILALTCANPARAARWRVLHRGQHGRTTVVVHHGFPVRRAFPVVVVRPARVRVVVAPRVFLAPVVWTGAVVSAPPAPSSLLWEDAETLSKSDDWTEFTLNVDRDGRKLYLEVAGQAQFEFAEVVFANGETQVVDFETKAHDTGLYSLLDFADGRKVDHVRMVARAKSDQATVVLRMS